MPQVLMTATSTWNGMMRPALRRGWLMALALLVSFLALTGGAMAQAEPKRSPLGVPLPSITDKAQRGPVAATEPAGILDRAWIAILEAQRAFRERIALAVREMKQHPFGAGFVTLVLASFTYGVLHAAGPGHGKGVISAWVLANRQTMRRGVALSFLSAAFQALTAIAIFAVLSLLMGARQQDFMKVESWLETLSWGLIAVLGAYLLYRQVRPLLRERAAHRAAATSSHAGHEACCGHDHGHAHDHSHTQGLHHTQHAHDIHDGHDHSQCCGHGHMPTPKELEGAWSWRRALALAFSVGIRPCSGALAVLALTTLNGLFWAGVASTVAMAFGTAITVSALAAVAVGSRDLAARLSGEGSAWAYRIANAAGVAGALALFTMGAAFFVASLQNGGGPF